MTGTSVRTVPASAGVRALALLGLVLWSPPRAQDLCEFIFTACPSRFQGDTIHMPENVVAMGSRIHTCEGDISQQSQDTTPPSIMFVIDNSGSMSGLGAYANDRMGSRFSVTLALLDEIYAWAPNARVGVAVFQNILYFDHRDDPFFTQLPGAIDGVPDQSYIPLTRLSELRGDGNLGIDKLKEVMATDTTSAVLYDGTVQDYVHLRYIPSDTSNHTRYTNINVGFMAAKQAFAATSTPKDHQFIIFFSDGEPLGPMQAGLDPYYFGDGDSVPTTFTVYFTSSAQAPASLQTMTDNISANGYSLSNPSSDLWTIQTNHDALLALIMQNVMGTIFMSRANSMTVTGTTVSDTSTTYVDSYFVFADPVGLQPEITPFDINYTFRIQGTTTPRDTSVIVSLWVERDPAAPAAAPPGIEYTCWPRPTLQIRHDGTAVSLVHDTMDQLEVRFTPGYPGAQSVIVPIESSIDSESVTLSPTGTYFSGVFARNTAVSGTAGDGAFVHRFADSIVVVYRDHVGIHAYGHRDPRCVKRDLGIAVTATLRDTSGDGHLDRIDLSWTDSSTLRADTPSVAELIDRLQLTLADGSRVSLHAVEVVPDYAHNTIHIILKENAGPALETDWRHAGVALTDIPMGKDGERMMVTRTVDAAGPVIERVELRPGSRTGVSDSLRITFSEPVVCGALLAMPPESVFVYYSNRTTNDEALDGSVFAGRCSTGYVSQVTVVLRNSRFAVTAWEDRIGFGPGATPVTDSCGNSVSLGTRTVAVEGAGKNHFELTVSSNPVTPGVEIDSRVRTAYANVVGSETQGVVIGIYSKIPLAADSADSGGETATLSAYANLDPFDRLFSGNGGG